MTEPLYYSDTLMQEFSAPIADIRSTGTEVVLHRTAFYPEGGGQPADWGTIAGVPVTDVQKSADGAIVHTLAHPLPEKISPGDTVNGVLDWEHRWEYMQQHTGQHLLSGALYRVAGAETVSVHQGTEVTTIEIHLPSLPDSVLLQVEEEAQTLIAEHREVRGFTVQDSDLPRYTLRRPTTRRGTIRLVEIQGYDLVACGGVHVPHTGAVQLVRLAGVESIRGHLRLAYHIGTRALADYRMRHRALSAAAELFSARPEQVPERITAIQRELQDTNRTVRLHGRRIAELLVHRLTGKDPRVPSAQVISLSHEPEEVFKAMIEVVSEDSGARLCLVNVPESPQELVGWAVIIGADHDFPRQELQDLLKEAGARGGGRPPVWRGVVPPGKPRELFVSRLEALLHPG